MYVKIYDNPPFLIIYQVTHFNLFKCFFILGIFFKVFCTALFHRGNCEHGISVWTKCDHTPDFTVLQQIETWFMTNNYIMFPK